MNIKVTLGHGINQVDAIMIAANAVVDPLAGGFGAAPFVSLATLVLENGEVMSALSSNVTVIDEAFLAQLKIT